MKQWKNGEQFSSKDYTSERSELVQKITNVNTEALKKAEKKFILSDTPPDTDSIGVIWMNPNEFNQNGKNYDYQIVTSVATDGYKSVAYFIPVEQTVTLDFTTTGYKIEGIEVDFVDYTIDVSAYPVGYKEQIEELTFDKSVNVSVTPTGYKEQILYESAEATINVDFTPTGYKEQLLYFGVSDTITVSASTAGYKEQIDYFSVGQVIQVSVSPTGYKEQLEYLPISDTITVSSDATGYKEQLEYLTVSDTITVSSDATGYKEQLAYTTVTDTVSLSASANGFKAYGIYGESTIPFVTDFTVDGTETTVSIDETSQLLTTIPEDQLLVIDAPYQIDQDLNKYILETIYFVMGENDVFYQIAPGNLPYNLYVTGTLQLSFSYQQVPVIPISAKATDLSAGSQFFPELSIQLLDDSNNVLDTITGDITNDYTTYASFEDSANYKIKLTAESSYTSGSYRQFTFNGFRLYYYNLDNQAFDFIDSNGANPWTFDPDTSQLFPPYYEKVLYVESRYTSVQGSPPATSWSYSGSSNTANATTTSLSTTIQSTCGDLNAILTNLNSARPPQNYNIGDTARVEVSLYYGSNFCNPRYYYFTAQ